MTKRKAPAGSLARRFDLMKFTDDLAADLRALRAGTISVQDARVRADLARQVLRSIGFVITAQKMLEGKALPAPADDSVEHNGMPPSAKQHDQGAE